MKRLVVFGMSLFCWLISASAQNYIIPSSGAPIEAYNLHENGNYIFYQEKNSAPDQFKMIEKDKVEYIKRDKETASNTETTNETKKTNVRILTPPSENDKKYNVLDKGNNVFVYSEFDEETKYGTALINGVKKGIEESGYWNIVDSSEMSHFVIKCHMNTSGRDKVQIWVRSAYDDKDKPEIVLANVIRIGAILLFERKTSEDIEQNISIGKTFVKDLISYIEKYKDDTFHFLKKGTFHTTAMIFASDFMRSRSDYADKTVISDAPTDLAYYGNKKDGLFSWWCYRACKKLPDNFKFSVSGTMNSHDYVDMGTGIKWATCNIGAGLPEEMGNTFAWGKTVPKEIQQSQKNDDINDASSQKYTKKNNKKVLEKEDDAASCILGGAWRMPTINDFEKLDNNCITTYVKYKGVYGNLLKSKVNDNTLFMPEDMYWSSTINENDDTEACCYWVNDSHIFTTTWHSPKSLYNLIRAVAE